MSGSDVSVEVVLIAAVAENGVIGIDGELPWYYPEDLQHFKQETLGHPVVAGRVTHEGIVDHLGGPLPDRETLVLTRQGVQAHEGVTEVASIAEALECAASLDTVVYVIGGASVYEQFLDTADRLVITEIPESPDGDTTFPDWDSTEWVETDRDEKGGVAFVTYDRRN